MNNPEVPATGILLHAATPLFDGPIYLAKQEVLQARPQSRRHISSGARRPVVIQMEDRNGPQKCDKFMIQPLICYSSTVQELRINVYQRSRKPSKSLRPTYDIPRHYQKYGISLLKRLQNYGTSPSYSCANQKIYGPWLQ